MKEKLSIKRGRGPLDNSGFLGRVEREILILERENEIVWMGRKRNGGEGIYNGGKSGIGLSTSVIETGSRGPQKRL